MWVLEGFVRSVFPSFMSYVNGRFLEYVPNRKYRRYILGTDSSHMGQYEIVAFTSVECIPL